MTREELESRYQAAERLLTRNTRTAVLNGSPSIIWEEGQRTFHYNRQVRGGDGIDAVTVRIDAESGQELDVTETPSQPAAAAQDGSTYSPDGRYRLFYEDYNLISEDTVTGSRQRLTTDGVKDCEYGVYIDIYSQITSRRQGYVEHPLVLWSPDGTRFVTYKADRRTTRSLYLIESYVDDISHLRPRLDSYPCPFVTDADDEIPHYSIYIGNAADGSMVRAELPDFLYPIFTAPEKSSVRWMDDGRSFYVTWIARGYQEARLYLVDGQSGASNLVLTETTDRFLNLGAFDLLDGYGNYQFSNCITQSPGYAFWQSERSGYAHLYRYRLQDGGGSVLEGDLFGEEYRELIVQKLLRVDEANRRIYFMANNVPECSDPMYYQLYVVGFDGSGLRRLTPEDASHQISIGANAFVDTYSRVDLPPVTVLRSLDGALIRELEQADIRDLLALGYQIPERITLTAGDGKTTLYGIFIPPAQDAQTGDSWPLIDYIYGGAQLYNVPRTFVWDNAMGREILGGLQSFAQMGFAGIILDGRGVPGRGLDFHAESYHKIHACAGLADHVYVLRELQERYPQIDLIRVGMWGNSAGGYATVSAMLQYPEVYRAGCASSGNYDQRIYEHSWTERYNGLYDEDVYQYGDVTRLAGNLKGRLMLAYGAMDDNVTMSQTLRLCDELNAHDKNYELVVLPRTNHNVPANDYFVRRKMDFFVRTLLGEAESYIFA